MRHAEVTITRVKKYNAGWNRVICFNGVPVAIAKSNNRAATIAGYLMGDNAVDVGDGSLRRYLDKHIWEVSDDTRD